MIHNNPDLIANGKSYLGIDESNGRLAFSSNSGQVVRSANNSIALNTWYHVLVTRTKSVPLLDNLYINGILSGTANQNSATGAFNRRLYR